METTNDTTRGFIHFARAWYNNHANFQAGRLDVIDFGMWHADGSGNGAAMTWYTQGPVLEVANDGWEMLTSMPDLIATLGNLHGYNVTPIEFCELLLALGFEDRTPADRFGGLSTLKAEPSGITQRIMSGADVSLLLEVAPKPLTGGWVDPMVNVGDVLYYYAKRGDRLAMDVHTGCGWYIGTVTGRPSALAAEVTFLILDGCLVREIATRDLYPEAPITAPVLNELEFTTARERDERMVEPLFSLGERVYYYAPWGDKLAEQLGEGWYVGEVSEALEDAARVGFIVQDGFIPEMTIRAPLLRTMLHAGTVAQNADMRAVGDVCYYESSDYGWLKVTIISLADGMACIDAKTRDDVLISSRDWPVPQADLKDALPADTLAWNEPFLAQRENGNPDKLICPNCEHGQMDDQEETINPDNLHECIQCHFIFIRPTRQEGVSNAM